MGSPQSACLAGGSTAACLSHIAHVAQACLQQVKQGLHVVICMLVLVLEAGSDFASCLHDTHAGALLSGAWTPFPSTTMIAAFLMCNT